MNDVLIVIPSLNPANELLDYVDSLIKNGFGKILLIDDGSNKDESIEVFKKLENNEECVILRHAVNMGKGRALKDAFNYYQLYFADKYTGIVTVDSDGQHCVEDVIKMAEALKENPESLILGVRDFDQDNVPFKSKFGNKITKFVMKLLYGGNISDTQTGLRGIPNKLINSYITLFGERFEYETTMLIETLQRKISIHEVKIRTIYINDNSETHFKPLQDSLKIYKLIFGTFFKYLLSSVSSALIDFLFFGLFVSLLHSFDLAVKIGVATVLARIISSIYNYTVNKNIVFKSNKKRSTFIKYYILFFLQMCCSAAGVYLICRIGLPEFWSKVIVDTVLFLISFQIQRIWIFSKEV